MAKYKFFLAGIFMLLLVLSAHAQSSIVRLIDRVELKVPENVSLPHVIRQQLVKFNPDALKSPQIIIPLFEGETARFERAMDESSRVFEGGWSGKSAETSMGSLTITPTRAGYHATIFWGRQYYRIAPLGNGQHLLMEIDRSYLPDEDCRNLKANPAFFQKVQNTPDAPGDDPIRCNLRLLVLYTNAASNWAQMSLYGDALGLAQAAIDATNQTYINSQVVYRVELAHLARVNYTESGSFATDVDRLQDPADGNMDEIHALRNLYQADLCVLITQGNADCGRAFQIGATADEAFCAANADCCVDNFSFAHELGHLYGARHDPFADNTNSPFAFGHGFVQIAEKWRTVMSYNDACVDANTSCSRVGYWSNPNVNYPPTNTATGTNADNNNARVLNETGDDLRAYRGQSTDYTLNNTTLNGVTFADLTAINSIQAGNNYSIQPTADVRFRAGSFIRLTPGFEVRPNADFKASIQPIESCSVPRPVGDRLAPETSSNELLLSPNPVSERLNLHFNGPASGVVTVSILNSLGAFVEAPLVSQNLMTGNQSMEFSVSHLPEGMYWCVVIYPDHHKVHKSFVVVH